MVLGTEGLAVPLALGGTGNVLLHLKHSDSVLPHAHPAILHCLCRTTPQKVAIACLQVASLSVEALGMCYFITQSSWRSSLLCRLLGYDSE